MAVSAHDIAIAEAAGRQAGELIGRMKREFEIRLTAIETQFNNRLEALEAAAAGERRAKSRK